MSTRRLTRKGISRKSPALERIEPELEESFVLLAQRISNMFPDIDLRFTLQSGDQCIRYQAPDLSGEVFELDLALKSCEELIYEAAFRLKELGQLFDA